MMHRIGIDVGGTRLKVGRVVDGQVVVRAADDTPHDFDQMIEVLARLVRKVVPEGEPCTIGAGVPGVFDESMAGIVDSPNLRFLDGQPLRAALSKATGAEVRLGNDASVAALAEARYGKGREHSTFLLATIGTGIGGGLIFDGKLWEGIAGMAGEYGHLSAASAFVPEEIPLCNCGNPGCLEVYASASRMTERGRARTGEANIELPELANRARMGEPVALSVFVDAGRALGEGFAQVVQLLDIRVLLLGGGAGSIVDLVRGPLIDKVVERCAGRTHSAYTVDRAELGNDAGLLGASALLG